MKLTRAQLEAINLEQEATIRRLQQRESVARLTIRELRSRLRARRRPATG